jgi:triosephosphate isomerase (TIM)
MNKTIIGNWKMNPSSIQEAEALAKATDIEGYVMCPPFVYLEDVSRVISKATLGAQDVFFESPTGARTGEISVGQLKDLGVRYVIIGHSERRELGETDEVIAKKVKVVLETGLIPVLCVGENKADRDAGREKEAVKRQLEIDLFFASQVKNASELVVAYEPIWAISRGDASHPPADSKLVIEMINFIRETLLAKPYTSSNLKASQSLSGLNPVIIYGGSVNGKNAKDFLKHDEIEGALPGGASLKPDEVESIMKAVEE